MRILADFGAGLKVVINCFMEGPAQPFHGVRVEPDPVTNTGDAANKNLVLVIILDPGAGDRPDKMRTRYRARNPV